MVIAACAAAVSVLPLWAQDDSGAPPPAPTDNGTPPAQGDNGAAPAQDHTGQTPDDSGAPDSSVSFQTFYDALGSQGTWIQSSDYGYVWQPTETDPDWAPYTEGHWVYADAGWTWVSDEPWGWATYHYGRWVNLDGTGWCWVPGYTWAPAWVSWRYGNGYAGWAPLPPDSFVGIDYTDDGFSIGVGFHIGGDCDGFYGIGPGWYTFLPVTCLGYRSYHGYYCHRGDNYAIINHTTNVTNINVTRGGAATAGTFGHVTTGGPMLAQVNAVSATPVQRVSLVRSAQPGGGGTVSGNALALYAPRVAAGGTAQPQQVAGSIGRASINRGTDILRPLAVNSSMEGAAATEAQVQQARLAQNHAPASAKVMTDPSTVQPVLDGPLTAMKPVESEPAPSRIFSTTSVISNPQRTPSVYGNTPVEHTYPQASEPGSVAPPTYYRGPVTTPETPYFQPHAATTSSSGPAPQTHTYVIPGTPSGGSYTPATGTPVVHQGTGGTSSGGGYPGGGGAIHGQSGGSSYHGGTSSTQSQSH